VKLPKAGAILLASQAFMGGIASRVQAFVERTWPRRKGQWAGKFASSNEWAGGQAWLNE